MLVGFLVFPPGDPIARTYEFPVLAAGALVFLSISLVAGLLTRSIRVPNSAWRRGLWIAFSGSLALGPLALALRTSVVSDRIRRNDGAAQVRFLALKNAVEQAAIEAGGPDHLCDGDLVKHHYSGPPFRDQDWRFIAGNYVTADGYVFGIWCHQQGGYTIDASPVLPSGEGTRHFCTDESGKIGCGMEWNRSREACTACTR